MQRHKFRTSTIRKTCPARQAVQQSLANNVPLNPSQSLSWQYAEVKSLAGFKHANAIRQELRETHEFINRFMEGYTPPHCQNAQNA